MHALRTDPARSASERLRGALLALIGVGRDQPYLYQVMVSAPALDPAAAVRAAGRCQDEFLAIVATLVGDQKAAHYCALLITSAHGIAGMELSCTLGAVKWSVTAGELVDTLVRMVADAGETTVG